MWQEVVRTHFVMCAIYNMTVFAFHRTATTLTLSLMCLNKVRLRTPCALKITQ